MFDTFGPRAHHRLARGTLTALVFPLLFLTSASVAHAKPGAVVSTVITPFKDHANGVAVDRANRVVMAGTTFGGVHHGLSVTRYTADDQLDTSFGDNGVASLEIGQQTVGLALAIDHQNRIVVVGSTGFTAGDQDGVPKFDFVVARFLDNGQLDPSFRDGNGWQAISFGATFESAHAVLIDFDDGIFVAGKSRRGHGLFGLDVNDDFALTKLRPDGQIDTSFGDHGRVLTDFGPDDNPTAMAFDFLHRLIVVGTQTESGNDFSNVILACYRPDTGDLQQGFGPFIASFGAHYSAPSAVAIDDFGRILVAGLAAPNPRPDQNDNFAVARFTEQGRPDTSFGHGGVVQTDVSGGGFDDAAAGVVVYHNGRIVVGGSSRDAVGHSHFVVAGYDDTGALDPHFGDGEIGRAHV